MYDTKELSDKLKKIEESQKYIFEKNVDPEVLQKFKNIILKIGAQTKFIIKGSIALNKLLKQKIFKPEEELYKDLDILTLDPEEDIKLLYKELTDAKILYRCIKNKFKNNLYSVRLFGLFELSFVDFLQIDKHIYNIIPTKTINGVKYLSPEFYKIDMYSILAKYTDQNINLNHIEKVLPRIEIVEEEYKYETTKIIQRDNNEKLCNHILYKLKKLKLLVTGIYAYNILMEKVNIPYIELFINKNKIKVAATIIEEEFRKKNIKYNKKKYDKFGVMLNKFIVYTIDDKPIVFLYELVECTTYIEKNGIKYSSYYHLMNYFNLVKYINKLYNIYVDNNDYFLYKIYKKTKIFKEDCIGELNAGLSEHKNIIMNKEESTEINKYLTNKYVL